MDIRYYNTRDINLERLASELERMFVAQGVKTQRFGPEDQVTVKWRKGNEVAALFVQRHGCTVVKLASKKNASAPAPANTLTTVAPEVDFLITGLGD